MSTSTVTPAQIAVRAFEIENLSCQVTEMAEMLADTIECDDVQSTRAYWVLQAISGVGKQILELSSNLGGR